MVQEKITKKVTRQVTWDDGTKSTVHCEVGFIPSKEYGFFECYDEESGGEKYHTEGGLWFDTEIDIDDDGQWVANVKCVDYKVFNRTLGRRNGVYQLNDTVIELCKEMDLDMSRYE